MGDMDFVTVAQAAKFLDLTEQQVLRLIDRGFLKAEQVSPQSATGDEREFSIMGRRLKQCQAQWLSSPEWREVVTKSDTDIQVHRLMQQHGNMNNQQAESQL